MRVLMMHLGDRRPGWRVWVQCLGGPADAPGGRASAGADASAIAAPKAMATFIGVFTASSFDATVNASRG
jgi:hypothetical protein